MTSNCRNAEQPLTTVTSLGVDPERHLLANEYRLGGHLVHLCTAGAQPAVRLRTQPWAASVDEPCPSMWAASMLVAQRHSAAHPWSKT